MIEVHNYELNPAPVFLIQTDRAACLPLRVVAALPIQEDIGGLPRRNPVVHTLAGDQGPVLTVTGVVEFGIQLQILARERGRNQAQCQHYREYARLHHSRSLKGNPNSFPTASSDGCR